MLIYTAQCNQTLNDWVESLHSDTCHGYSVAGKTQTKMIDYFSEFFEFDDKSLWERHIDVGIHVSRG